MPDTRQESYVGMCVCQQGFVMQENRCIPLFDCGCQVIDETGSFSGIWVPDGYRHMTTGKRQTIKKIDI